MISRKNRFHGSGSLKFVLSRGKTVRGTLFAVKSIQNNRIQSYRAAVVVGRKVQKSAVKRNRIRRRLFEIIRSLDHEITGHYDIVLTIFSDQILETPVAELEQQLKKQLKDSGVVK